MPLSKEIVLVETAQNHRMSLETWRETRLGEIVEPKRGLQTGPFGSQLHAADYVADGIPVVMPRDLVGNVIDSDIPARVAPGVAAQLDRYRLLAGDVVFARRGQIGRCALVRPVHEGWLCGTGCLRARLASSVDPEFLFHLMQWPPTVAWMTENAVGQTMQNLNTRILAALPLRIPILWVQVRIAEVLSSIDATIETIRRVLAQTATVNEGFLDRLLAHGLASRLGPKREIPAEWHYQSLGDLCSFTTARGFKACEWSATGLPIIRIQNLNGSRDFNYFAGAPKEQWVVEAGDLLFAWAGVKGTSFGPCIWRGPRGVLNQHIYKVRPRDGVDKLWLYATLRQVTQEIEERAQGFKSSLLHVRKADMAAHRVAVPPRPEQEAIAERFRAAERIEAAEASTLEAVARLKKALMDDLFSGRVRVDRPLTGRPSEMPTTGDLTARRDAGVRSRRPRSRLAPRWPLS